MHPSSVNAWHQSAWSLLIPLASVSEVIEGQILCLQPSSAQDSVVMDSTKHPEVRDKKEQYHKHSQTPHTSTPFSSYLCSLCKALPCHAIGQAEYLTFENVSGADWVLSCKCMKHRPRGVWRESQMCKSFPQCETWQFDAHVLTHTYTCIFLGGHIRMSVTHASWVSFLPAYCQLTNTRIYRLQITPMSMPQVSHIILLHFTQQLWSSYCNKPLLWLFPCSPSLCAARTKAGQKGTRKGSCNKRWESKKEWE